jgi:hypothetical protein
MAERARLSKTSEGPMHGIHFPSQQELPEFCTDLIAVFVVLFFLISSGRSVNYLCVKFPPPSPFASETVVIDNHLSLAAFFMTDYRSYRIPYLWRYIQESVHHPAVNFEYYFVNYTRQNVSELHSLYPPSEYRKMMNLTSFPSLQSADLTAKFFFSLAFFLEHSRSRWFFRGTDDTVINFDYLPVYLSKLEHSFDTEKDFVFRGNCVTAGIRWPQGGSGYLLSRAAARQIQPYGPCFMRAMTIPEDMTFGRFLPFLGKELFDTTDEAFVGHYFGGETIQLVQNRRYGLLPLCPDPQKFQRVGCRPYVSPVRHIVFYHEWRGGGILAFNHARSLFSSDPVVGWWIPPNTLWPKMCRFT